MNTKMQQTAMTGQRGAVLIVSLVVLLAITLMGVAGMNNSVMQERMAANAQNSNRAFQGAESAAVALVERLYADDLSVLRESMKAADGMSSTTNFTADSGNDITGVYQAEFLGEIIINSGSSMDANESSTLLKGFRYQVSGSATMANTGAETTVFKGIEYY